MARLNIGEVEAFAGRTEDFDWSAYEGDGRTPVVFAADDVVRFKLSSTIGDSTPELDIDSISATANGSIVTITDLDPATGRVRLGQADTASFSGKKYFELSLVDNSETSPADAIKVICRGTMVFTASQGGDAGVS